MKRSPRSGFTLIELLAVIALIAVVIAFAVPATTGIMKGTQMSQASQVLNDTLLLARQLAVTKNRPIEVRFYRYGDPDTPGEDFSTPENGKWRALQLFEVYDNGAVLPYAEMVRMPRGIIFQPDEYSTLLKEELRPAISAKEDKRAPELPIDVNEKRVGRNYLWTGFRYLPDGSTDLPPVAAEQADDGSIDDKGDRWYLTLLGLVDENKDIRQTNFYTIQVDPVAGTLKSFRPQVR
jgi:uncharacterized protein (TIGR02596 family)